MPTLEEIKAGQQAAWSSGDFAKIAWLSVPIADALVEAVDIRAGSKVLDVATGTGHVALAAARRFCDTTGIDYVPALIEVARRRAAAEKLEVDFRVGDAENLEFADATFDYVLSAIGAMFAPDHQKVADELVRVCRPGGTVGMVNWTPTGFVGELFAITASHAPPPPEVKPAVLWGTEDHVRALFGDGVTGLTLTQGALAFRFTSPEHYADFFLTYFGPTVKAAERTDQSALRSDLADLVRRHARDQKGAVVWPGDYVIVSATKR